MAIDVPTGQPSGNHQMNLSFNTLIPVSTTAGTSSFINSYSVPVNISYTQAYSFYGVTSSPTANSINKVVEVMIYNTSGTHAIDLSAQKCTDGTGGIKYVREIFIFNDATTATFTLDYDLGSTTSLFIAPFVTGGTSTVLTNAKTTIYPGTYYHNGNPLYATGGWDVTTKKDIIIDHGANTFTSRVVIIGGN